MICSKASKLVINFLKVARFSLNGPGTNDFYHQYSAPNLQKEFSSCSIIESEGAI